MKKPAFIIALLLPMAAAASPAADNAAQGAQLPSEQSQAHGPGAEQPTRLAEGLLENFWGREHHGEDHRGRRARHSDDDDDDDDDGREGGRNGGANRQADPNAANAPVPDNGVFSGKSRPKVEVQ